MNADQLEDHVHDYLRENPKADDPEIVDSVADRIIDEECPNRIELPPQEYESLRDEAYEKACEIVEGMCAF